MGVSLTFRLLFCWWWGWSGSVWMVILVGDDVEGDDDHRIHCSHCSHAAQCAVTQTLCARLGASHVWRHARCFPSQVAAQRLPQCTCDLLHWANHIHGYKKKSQSGGVRSRSRKQESANHRQQHKYNNQYQSALEEFHWTITIGFYDYVLDVKQPVSMHSLRLLSFQSCWNIKHGACAAADSSRNMWEWLLRLITMEITKKVTILWKACPWPCKSLLAVLKTSTPPSASYINLVKT